MTSWKPSATARSHECWTTCATDSVVVRFVQAESHGRNEYRSRCYARAAIGALARHPSVAQETAAGRTESKFWTAGRYPVTASTEDPRAWRCCLGARHRPERSGAAPRPVRVHQQAFCAPFEAWPAHLAN